MSNQLEQLMPMIVSRGILQFRETAILPRLVNSSLSAEAAQRGDSIKVPISQPVEASDVVPSHQMTAPPDTSAHSVTVPLNNWKRAAFHLTDREMLQIEAQSSFVPLQMAEAINALANAVNQSVLDLHPVVTAAIGSPGETPFQSEPASGARAWHGARAAIEARKHLNKAAAPKAGRFAVIDYEMEANALGLPQFYDAEKSGSTSVPMEGEIGRKFGIDWYSSDLLPAINTDLTDVTLQSNASKGDTSLIVQAPATSVQPGDVLVKTRTDAPLYVVTEVTAVQGRNSQSRISINRPLAENLSSGSTVTFKNNFRVGLVMHRDAVALAMRPLTNGGLETGASGHIMSVTDPQTGLSLRLEVSRQYKQTVWEFDVLWGVALLRPELAVKIYG